MFPDLTLFYMSIYGGFGYDYCSAGNAYLGLATGISQVGNPPYDVIDFLNTYPKFYGPATNLTGTVEIGSNVISAVSAVAGINPGQLIANPAFADGTIVMSITGNDITVSSDATSAGSITFSIFLQPPMALAIIQIFLNLAYASLMKSRWREMWQVAMGWYIAHFLTLYLQSEGTVANTPGQIATSGLEKGLTVSKAVGDVSVSYEQLSGLEAWAAWNLTLYGVQLATMARAVGCGPIYVRG